MAEKVKSEDVLLEQYIQRHAVIAFKKYEPYSPCLCKSGKKFKFCCKPLKKKSKTWEMTCDIINDYLTKKRITGKLQALEGDKI